MNGEIFLSSELGVGSEFRVIIPFVNTADCDSNQDSVYKIDSLKKNLKVIIAEGDLNSFLIYSAYARNANWNIIHVINGIEAVETARENLDVDLILMDIRMPLMNGATAAKKIREFLPDVVIIAQSAFAPNQNDSDQTSLFNKYVTKPIDKRTFIRVIGECIIN
jgi:CheY-like chemotaxis protein